MHLPIKIYRADTTVGLSLANQPVDVLNKHGKNIRGKVCYNPGPQLLHRVGATQLLTAAHSTATKAPAEKDKEARQNRTPKQR